MSDTSIYVYIHILVTPRRRPVNAGGRAGARETPKLSMLTIDIVRGIHASTRTADGLGGVSSGAGRAGASGEPGPQLA